MKNSDFTLTTYKRFFEKIMEKEYKIMTFQEYLKNCNSYRKIVIMRKDIDKRPSNALDIAKIESEYGIRTSYYFRVSDKGNDEEIIKEIASLGHEIGYHYEDLAQTKGDFNKAIKRFEKNLDYLKQFYPVNTICMHGSPLSKWDNKAIWTKFNYHDYGIVGDFLFDLDFNQILYLTDTGRRWDGYKVSIRDKIKQNIKHNLKTTFGIIDALEKNNLPDKIVITTHPQRWSDNIFLWYKELISQNIKNMIKKSFFMVRKGYFPLSQIL